MAPFSFILSSNICFISKINRLYATIYFISLLNSLQAEENKAKEHTPFLEKKYTYIGFILQYLVYRTDNTLVEDLI